ncbi:MAG TPA: protein translocase subunit SecF [Candidatus Paceibacterota bacterium]|jgi:preprotein translocase subunit SecF|nr:protein translocase subunit SecF [Candidatus Paceibacterota bacterium]
MWIINNRKILYVFTAILLVVSIGSLALWGLKPGIDFAGGTLIEVSYPASAVPTQASLISGISAIDPSVSVRPSGTDGYFIRMKAVSQAEKASVASVISAQGTASSTIKSFDSIGPILGAESLRKAIVSIILVILGIVLYITFAFRKVSEPVKSWKYGLIAIISLVHDIIIPLGAFAILGHYAGYEVDTLFVTALLVILGFSIHNTIVVFDRVRENLSHSSSNKPFVSVVGESVNQTLTRSINTSLTVLIALVSLYIFGGEATQHFTLALIIGILAGTYSSVCFGSSLLVTFEQYAKRK